MKRKKMLIAIALVVIMLLNCIAPLLQVQAASAKTEMSFNPALYKGLKSYFQEQGISANYNDGLYTIKMEDSVIASIEELSLKEKEISNLTGLDVFTGVKRLILSGNNLDETSNLEVLNNFPNLIYLDISSNEISDISSIQELVERLIALDSNAINLTSQVVKQVVDVSLKEDEQLTEVEFSLPQILQIAGIADGSGITNKGQLKADWVSGKYYTKSNSASFAPYIIDGSIPNPVTAEKDKFKIKVGQDNAGSFTQYQGLVKWVISIKDITNSSYNQNPASKNILKDSIFTLYFVVHNASSEGVIFKDRNLYNAVKDQLTKNQEINPELLSYKYTTTEDDDIYYDYCDVTISGTTATLKINGETVYTIENFNSNGYDGNSLIKKASGSRYEIQYYEVEYQDSVGTDSVVTRKLKVKVPHYNSEARNLYIDAYDEPFALVISDLDIINKITSLILNDQRIEDLSGLEKFVGLESNLNVSFNYIDTLASIYALQLNKEANNATLQAAFNERKSAMATAKSKILSAYSNVESILKQIKDEIAKIEQAIKEANALDASAENYDEQISKYVETINTSEKKINGDGTEENPGLISELEKALNDSSEGLNVNLTKIYPRLQAMYTVFNKEYRLTTLLTPELNYQTEEEYDSFVEKMKTLEGAKGLVSAEFSRISSLENANALSQLEKDLIVSALGLSLSDNEDKPISKALSDREKDLTETNAGRSSWTSMIYSLIEVDIYAQAENYCLLERMNNDTASGACYAEKYLAEKIEEFDYEGIDTSLLRAIYEKVSKGSTALKFNSNLFNIFNTYRNGTRTTVSTSGTAYFCKGAYHGAESLSYKKTTTTKSVGKQSVTYTDTIKLTEKISSLGTNETDIYFYNQLMSLANKFTAIDETSRYVVLPGLKRIDIRNNEIQTLGETTVRMVAEDGTVTDTVATLATLKNLKELYAGHNIVTGDISCVDWSTLTSLKKLDLSYNFITDISPLQVLKNLRYLDVSDNLLEGAFNLSLKEMEKLQDVILAGNKYTDISKIIADYEMVSGGDLTKYFAREDTLNIDLSRQVLEIDLTEQPIAFDSNNSVYAVELPPIFAQLEFIDAQRTAYGTTSSKGSIEAKGGTAYIPISKNGEYVGEVTVIAKNGFPEDVTTSIGIGTTCTIKYVVLNVSVSSVKINEEDITSVEIGKDTTFTATVEGENVPDTSVEWSVEGNLSSNTKISPEGVLTVGADETATELTIVATSNYDDSKEARKTVTLFSKEVTTVTVNGDDSVDLGGTATYTAVVEGNNLTDANKTVTWSVSGNTSEETVITPEGVLTVGADEEATELTVTATSTFDSNKTGTKTVVISSKSVTSVAVNEQDVTMRKGTSKTFTATVEGEKLEDADKTVTWSVSGNTSDKTVITSEGVLTVGADEESEELTVTATSTYDVSKNGTAKVTVKQEEALPELGYTLDSDDDIVGVSPDTSSNAFKQKLLPDSSYTVSLKRDGEELADTKSVATGDLVTISKDGKVIATFEVVVKGDVNGDGTVDVSDTRLVKSHRAKVVTLTGLFFKAGDVDNDGDITISDVRIILAHRAKIDGYIL